MAKLCIFLIKLYRRYISRYTRPTCRFSPTCSSYAMESYKRFGFFLGTYLTIKRLLKCHPFYKGEYFDNVPLFKREIFKFNRKKCLDVTCLLSRLITYLKESYPPLYCDG